jgi:phosphoglycerol transferase MdoB-like AlkP superfamily enzyme
MKMNRFSLATILTIFILILFMMDMITDRLFVIAFIPLSIWMLFIGVSALKKTLKSRNTVKEDANKLK